MKRALMLGNREGFRFDRRYLDWIRWIRAGWALAAGFAALSVFIAASVIFYVQQQAGDAVVRRALQIEVSLADVFSGLQDAEVGQRGFLLTGDAAFLQPSKSGEARLRKHMTEFSDLISGIEELTQPVQTLRRLSEAKKAEMAQSIALFQSGRVNEALTLVRGGSGKEIMDEIRAQIEAIDAREDRVVSRRQAEVQRIGVLVSLSTTASVILLGVVTLAAMREVIRRTELSRFLPAEIADRIAEGDLSLKEGRELPAAIVFVDIRGSTELAERVDTVMLSTLLSRFRGHVLTAAQTNGGLVDKFIGDGALVVFGVHDPNAAAGAQAIAFARDLRERHRFRDDADRENYKIGIGIHYGNAFCGIVGTAGRLEFTVLGDAVNVAARLEKETKVHGVDLLVSDAVLLKAGESLDDWREVTCGALRGRRASITLFTDRQQRAEKATHSISAT